MRVRALDTNGDMTWGFGSQNFLIDNVQLVKQKILTGLNLWAGDYFLDTTKGMPWATKVLGRTPQAIYDAAIQQQIRGTKGVTGVTQYSSSFNPRPRALSVVVSVSTLYGPLTIATSFAPPLVGGFGVGGFSVNGFGQ